MCPEPDDDGNGNGDGNSMPPPPSSQEKGKQKEEQNHVPSLNETPNGTSNGTANGTASRGTTPGLGLSLNPAASTFTPAALPTQAGDAANGVAPQNSVPEYLSTQGANHTAQPWPQAGRAFFSSPAPGAARTFFISPAPAAGRGSFFNPAHGPGRGLSFDPTPGAGRPLPASNAAQGAGHGPSPVNAAPLAWASNERSRASRPISYSDAIQGTSNGLPPASQQSNHVYASPSPFSLGEIMAEQASDRDRETAGNRGQQAVNRSANWGWRAGRGQQSTPGPGSQSHSRQHSLNGISNGFQESYASPTPTPRGRGSRGRGSGRGQRSFSGAGSQFHNRQQSFNGISNGFQESYVSPTPSPHERGSGRHQRSGQGRNRRGQRGSTNAGGDPTFVNGVPGGFGWGSHYSMVPAGYMHYWDFHNPHPHSYPQPYYPPIVQGKVKRGTPPEVGFYEEDDNVFLTPGDLRPATPPKKVEDQDNRRRR